MVARPIRWLISHSNPNDIPIRLKAAYASGATMLAFYGLLWLIGTVGLRNGWVYLGFVGAFMQIFWWLMLIAIAFNFILELAWAKYPRTVSTPIDTTKYQGVGGILFIFCLLLLIVRPLIGLTQIRFLLSLMSQQSVLSEGETLINLDSAVLAGIIGIILSMAGAVYVGWNLLEVKPGARKQARIYFVFELIIEIIIYLGIYLMASHATLEGLLTGLTQAVMWSGIGLFYLSNSIRVRATYEVLSETNQIL
jgi:hypothetical protein